MINNDQPQFLGVSEILQNSTNHTLNLLERELKINLEELQEKFFKPLEEGSLLKREYIIRLRS